MQSNKELAIEKIEVYRDDFRDYEAQLKELETLVAPPALQEVVLARRDLESSRMRLGMALGYVKE